MLVYDIPAGEGAGVIRAAVLGSCRVRDTLMTLERSGDLHHRGAGLDYLHCAGEARQALEVIRGERSIPDFLSPYVFDKARTPPTDHLKRLLDESPDVFVLEVSDDKQFAYGDVALQQNFLSRNLIQAHRGALLAWYRQISRGQAADEAVVEAALEALRKDGFEPGEAMAELLRGTRLQRHEADDITTALGAMMEREGGRWIIVGPFQAPGHEGKVMRDRAALTEKLRVATARCGARLWDASELIASYGVAGALDGGGANVYEFTNDFRPLVGRELLGLIREAAPETIVPRPPAPPPRRRRKGWKAVRAWVADTLPPSLLPVVGLKTQAPPATVRAQLATDLNQRLVRFLGRRLETMGLEDSGLYQHYKALIAGGAVIRDRERAVLDLVDAYLPAYDAYAVMRAGVGELALLLAANGRRVIATEPNAKRRAALEAAAAHLRRARLIAPGALTVVRELVPAAAPARTLGVGLDVVSSEGSATRGVDMLGVFDGLLIDPRTLFRLREGADERDRLIEDLMDRGFAAPRAYPSDRLAWFQRASKPAAQG